MRKIKILFFKIIFISMFCTNGFSQNNIISKNPTAAEWREDLRFLSTKLIERHPNPFHDVSREKFETAVKSLDAKIDELNPHQIIVEMAKIVALIGEGHTRLDLPRKGNRKFGRYPIKFYVYENGVFVQEIAQQHKEIVGRKVVKIGESLIKEVIKKVNPVVHHDNEMTRKLLLPLYIDTPEVLQSLGIIKNSGDLKLTVEAENGEQRTIQMSPVENTDSIKWISANNSATKELPLWQKKIDDDYWFEFLEDHKTVYLQFNSVRDKKEESIAQFSERLHKFIEANPVEKLILDLRLNDGGNSRLARPLLHAIIRSDKINQKGKFFTIIGRKTFSATIVFAVELNQHTNTIFVGEPTGGSPNQYGEMVSFILPNSGLTVNHSAYLFQTAGPFENGDAITPEIAVAPTIESFRQNQDPVLDAIFSYKPSKSLFEQIFEAYKNDGIESAVNAYRKFKNSPENRYINTERPIRLVGNQLLEEKKYNDAETIYKLNTEAYPERSVPYFSLAELYLEKSEKQKAKAFYLKGLSKLESDITVHKAFEDRLRNIISERLKEIGN